MVHGSLPAALFWQISATLLLSVSVSFLSFVLVCFLSKTQKDQKYFCCYSLPFVYFGFLLLFCFVCYRWFAIRKPKKIFLCLLVFFCSCFQFENTKNIWCSSLVCKVHHEFNGLRWLERGFHFILSKLHKWKAIMTIYDNLIVVRGWYELYLFSFLYIYSSMWACLVGSCEVYVI